MKKALIRIRTDFVPITEVQVIGLTANIDGHLREAKALEAETAPMICGISREGLINTHKRLAKMSIEIRDRGLALRN